MKTFETFIAAEKIEPTLSTLKAQNMEATFYESRGRLKRKYAERRIIITIVKGYPGSRNT